MFGIYLFAEIKSLWEFELTFSEQLLHVSDWLSAKKLSQN